MSDGPFPESIIYTALVVAGSIVTAVIRKVLPQRSRRPSPSEERAQATAEWRDLYEQIQTELEALRAQQRKCEDDRHELLAKISAMSWELALTKATVEQITGAEINPQEIPE